MLSLAELRRATRLLDRELADARLERVIQLDARRVLLALNSAQAGTAHVLVSTETGMGRLSRVAAKLPAPPSPPAFAQLLRARIGKARLRSVRIVDDDRQAALRFSGEGGDFELLLALMGPRTNCYLLDAEGVVLGSLRPLSATRRDLRVGGPWRGAESKAPPEGADRFAEHADEQFFAAVEAWYKERASEQEQDGLRRRLEKGLRKGLQTARKKCEKLRADGDAMTESETLRQRGELLKSVVGRVRPGDREVRARDFESGDEVVIELDPTLGAKANLETIFRRARKAAKRAERAWRELGDAEAREQAVEALAGELEAIGSADDERAQLEAFAERADVARVLERFAPEVADAPDVAAKPRPSPFRVGKRELPRRLWPRRYRSSDGLEIWVGRSDEGNDLLSTRLARGNDLFFHLDASPGSHVVLRTEGRSDPPQESLLEACELAVHFSKQRKVTRADVLVAAAKGVRKPRGAKPGLVYVTGGRSIHLRRDARRLERVLGDRIADD